jgi:hypothetical protein
MKASLSREASGFSRERDGDRPCWEEFICGLDFPLSCFASGQALIHQGVQGKSAKYKRINSEEKKCSREKIKTIYSHILINLNKIYCLRLILFRNYLIWKLK